jgi:hypothetical protein
MRTRRTEDEDARALVSDIPIPILLYLLSVLLSRAHMNPLLYFCNPE